MNKKDLRSYYRLLRKHDNLIDEKVKNNLLKLVLNYNSVACYMAIDEEINLNEFIKSIYLQKKIYLPYTGEVLEFREFCGFDELIKDKAGILSSSRDKIEVNNIEVIIMACIACNYDGYRLGYGKGYYDGALKDYEGLKIGVTYDSCLTTKSFQESHDIKLDYIVTESRIIKIG